MTLLGDAMGLVTINLSISRKNGHFFNASSGDEMTDQAREGASNSGWQVVFDDEVTEDHFCHRSNSGASVFCACSKMHAGIPRACSVPRAVLAQCKLGCDQRPETFR